ncbi:MAG: hypothetical protein IJ575_12220 [Selenomonadaceae bacterium]|nr:hypothetical protein [Selenomonadaceae bacterium]
MAYEPDKYLEFFVIDEGYYPEINESSIKDPKNKWQQTFPHTDIVALLKSLNRMLDRLDKKGLWIEGSYGTGKSRIVWMMENLLSCSDADFDSYFDEYDNLRNEIELRGKLKTNRNGGIVTAIRYATGDITSTRKLIFAVFESLSESLKKGKYKFDGAKTLRGKIASWLESDSANLEMFRAKIQKPEYRMSQTLGNRSAEEIIERLKNPQAEVSQLVEDILKLGEAEGIRAFDINMKDLIDWISEVIEENDLKAIVLFWDEFSKFFGNNRNNLDEFQRLAELSNIAPFYLVITTHQSESLAGEGDQAFRIVSDRFTHKNITMPDNIALELIGHALKVKDMAREMWDHIVAALVERTKIPREKVMEFAKIRDEKILINILPIHPMTAILLKNLASYFASNQRSIFNFIKNNDPNVKAFQDFIATKSPMNGDLLTIDCLWDFFYESGTDEHGMGVGRMNLKPSIRAILDSYSINKDSLNLDEQTVLKTILLFQAIDQESRGDVEIFRPTEKNLQLAFTGVSDLENGRAESIANDLVRKEILFRKPGKVETYAAMALSGDFAEIERLKKSLTESVKTSQLVQDAKLIESFNLTQSQKARYVLNPVTAEDFTRMINRLTSESHGYQIQVVICFARNEDEQNKIYNLLNGVIHDPRYHRLVFIDASSNTINREIFNRWIENSAHEKYQRGKDNALADKMKSNASDCLKEWYQSFENGSFVYYSAVKNESAERSKISCQNVSRITEELRDNVRRIYQYSFDDASITDTLFQSTNLKKMPECGVKQEEYSMLNSKQIKIVLGDLWQMSGKYWEIYPELNISRLKIELDSMIENQIKKDVRISFDEIFEFLLERGFMPLNIYAFLTGFLLKEYAEDPYRFSGGIDGNSGGAMNHSKLAECIGEAISQSFNPKKGYHPKYLEIMSPAQRNFMEFATKIFRVSEDVSVEQCAQKLRSKLKDLGYPLWCYADAVEDKYKDFLKLFAGIANSKESISVSALAEKAGQFLIEAPEAFEDLKKFFTRDHGREIFTDFLRNFDGGIVFDLAQKIGIEDVVTECQKQIASGDGIWLHDKETAEGELRQLIIDYKIVSESQKFGIEGKSMNSCMSNWREFCRFHIRVPADLIGDYYSPIKPFFSMLKGISERGDLSKNKRDQFLQYLVENAEIIRGAISDPIKILRERFAYQIEGLNEEEIQDLYRSLPSTSFTDSQGNYHKNIDNSSKQIKSNQIKTELLNLWNGLSNNQSPKEWSKSNRTPILAMIPKSEQSNAKKVFDTIIEASTDEKSVRFAIDWLEKNQQCFSDLNDKTKIDEAFRREIIGEFALIFKSNDEVRDELESKSKIEIYEWYPNVHVNQIIQEFVRNKYYTGELHDKLTERIERMSDREAKQLLIDLVDKNYEVGLKLLRES